jgi:hypothetical protein
LKTLKQKIGAPLAAFETGQVWKLLNSNLHIGMIGKRLVHYKHFKLAAKRAPISLCTKVALEHYLMENGAVLVPA